MVSDRPKVLADIAGRPFISHLLDYLEIQGIRRAVLAIGYLADHFEGLLGERHGSIQLLYSREKQPLGTAGAIAQALSLIGRQAFLVFNGDSFCPINLPDFIHHAIKLQTPATLVASFVSDTSRFGTVKFDDCGKVTNFAEKQSGASGWINAGIYFLDPQLVSSLPLDRPTSIERDLFPTLIPDRLGVFCVNSQLLDIGTPESYSAAQTFFQKH